jgi:hypothetical protein
MFEWFKPTKPSVTTTHRILGAFSIYCIGDAAAELAPKSVTSAVEYPAIPVSVRRVSEETYSSLTI